MAEDDSSREELRRLAEQLEQLERVVRAQTERLYRIETRLGIDFHPATQTQTTPSESIHKREDTAGTRRVETKTEPNGRTAAPHASDRAPHSTQESTSQTIPPPQAQSESRAAEETSGAGASSGVGHETRERSGVPFGGTIFRETAHDARSEDAGRPKAAPRRARDFESLVGGSWFNWLGIIAITIGVAFFLKYAFDNKWIGPTARVILGSAAGLGILFTADRLRARGLRQYAYVLSGGGILILYLSVYAAHAFYDLTGATPAFLLMSSVTAIAVALSVRYDALAIAILGLLGGFATPVLLSTGQDRQAALFTYLALLDAGVLAVAYFKSWRVLNFISFFLTVSMFVGWMEQHYSPAKLWPTLFFLTVFFLLFSALAPVHNVLRHRRARWHDLLLVVVNATFYFGLAYVILNEAGYHAGLASYALLLSSFYTLLFYLVWMRHRADLLLRYGYVGAAVTFFTTAVAIQLDWHWVTVTWGVEALMLAWVGLRSREAAPRHAALVVFGSALAHWFLWDMSHSAFRPDASFVPLLNARAFSAAALIVSLFAAAWLYRRAGAEVDERERSTASTFYTLAASGLGLVLLTIDTNDYFNQLAARSTADDVTVTRLALENTRQFSLTALWTFYGALLVVVGLLRGMRLLRYAAALLLFFTACKLAAVDSAFYAAAWHVTIFNQTFIAFALMAGALAACAHFCRRADNVPAEERRVAVPSLVVLANLSALAGLSLEALGYFDRLIAPLAGFAQNASRTDAVALEVSRLENNKWFALTFVWVVYGAAAFAYGARRKSKLLRQGALALLTVAALKVLMQDIAYYAAPWHVPILNQTFAAFALLVAALALVQRLYTKTEGVEEDERALFPVLVVGANLLLIIALSAEASGHFAARMREGGLSEGEMRDLQLAASLSLSVVWALYGGAMLAYGYVRRNKLLRVFALLLLVFTTLKVFFWDLAALEKIYRIISFAVLGLILLAVSYLYQKSLRKQDEEESEDTAAEEASS